MIVRVISIALRAVAVISIFIIVLAAIAVRARAHRAMFWYELGRGGQLQFGFWLEETKVLFELGGPILGNSFRSVEISYEITEICGAYLLLYRFLWRPIYEASRGTKNTAAADISDNPNS
jgi:hypothetical protein